MKVAHFTVITPKRCGLYETTRELVKGLRDSGVDSRLVDPLPDTNPEPGNVPKGEDRGALIADMEWAKNADVFVSHSGIGEMEKTGKPIILVSHGRPRHSFLTERDGGAAIYSHHYASNLKDNYKAIVTFWPEHKPYLEVLYPDKPVHYVQSSVDLDYWIPGEKKYNFQGRGGDVNIVCADADRNDIDIYEPLNAYALWARNNKYLNPKLHVFNRPKNMTGWNPLIKRIQDDGNMGMLVGWAKGLEHVYRAADLVITAHQIDVRTVRESMSCGCPVYRVDGIDAADMSYYIGSDRNQVRKMAERLFNPVNTAKQFEKILNDVVEYKYIRGLTG